MVKKLMKHELFSIFRVLLIPIIVIIALAILCRISLLSPINNSAEIGVVTLLLTFYTLGIIVVYIFSFFFCVGRFYKSLFTGEGYMTMSLPVTSDQLILTKILSAIIAMFTISIVCALSGCVFLLGTDQTILDVIYNIFSVIGNLLGVIWGEEPMLIVEAVILVIVSIPKGLLIFYFVLAIAQLCTTKNRTGIAVAIYIGIMFAWGILSQFTYDPILLAASEVSMHLYFWIEIIFNLVVEVVCYIVVRYILKNKINLIV